MLNYTYIENGENLEGRIIDTVNELSKNYKNIRISKLYKELFMVEETYEDGSLKDRYLEKREVVKIEYEDKTLAEKIIERLK